MCTRDRLFSILYLHPVVYLVTSAYTLPCGNAGEFALYSISYVGGTLQMTLSAGRRPDFVAGAPAAVGGPLGVERVVLYGVPKQVRGAVRTGPWHSGVYVPREDFWSPAGRRARGALRRLG